MGQIITNISYWEKDIWHDHVDFTIVGAGIVGLSTALFLKRQAPEAKIIILERGILPHGASTKNAGFLCFGSVGELADDLHNTGESSLLNTLDQRISGGKALLDIAGRKAIDYGNCGGIELFESQSAFQSLSEKIPYFNNLLEQHFGLSNTFKVIPTPAHFALYRQCIINQFEGRIHTGKMMLALYQKAIAAGILVINGTEVKNIERSSNYYTVESSGSSFRSENVILCTNAFTNALIPSPHVQPARNQVILTSDLSEPLIDATFHLDQGYYYFRPIGNKVLFGGGRHTFGNQEMTDDLDISLTLRNHLLEKMNAWIPQPKPITAEMHWSGILGIGENKTPEISKIEQGLYIGVKLGGMGVAIGSEVGRKLAELVLKDNGYK